MQETIKKYILMFFIYAITGWIMESTMISIKNKKFVNRGFLVGPICPIYGYGALLVTILLKKYQDDIVVTFFMSMIICGVLEYFTSYFMEKIFKNRWWDYSKKKFNINGRICLENLVLFGFASCFIIYITNPFIIQNLELIPSTIQTIIIIILFVIYLIDIIVSYKIILNLKAVSKELKDNTIEISEKVKNIILSKSIFQRRLVNAFPNIKVKLEYAKSILKEKIGKTKKLKLSYENMKEEENTRTYYYKDYDEDLVKSKNQDYKLKDNYKWIHNNIAYKFCSSFLYVIAYIISYFYCKLFLHIKIENREMLDKYKNKGYFLYGNHTQPIGDVFIPAHACKSKRIYTIVSQANLGVVGIGPLLPMLGAIPIPNTIKENAKMFEAVVKRISQKKCVVIYPEAHVWPYYTKIRPFQETAFNFPVSCNALSFAMTTTYRKRKFGKKPKIVVYIDGPFIPDTNLNKKDRQEKLCQEIYNCMQKRSRSSTYKYIDYKREK